MVEAITRGSILLTDDFLQALGGSQPAQMSKFILLNLPHWSTINATDLLGCSADELGLSQDVSDPNVLFAAAFNQYMQNLAGHARKQHAKVNDGKVIENFTEQAFWKFLAKLLKYQPIDIASHPEGIIIAELGDVITNINSTDGNASMETLLTIPAGTTKQAFTFANKKPAYLHDVAKLPDVTQATTLVGNLTACYDNQRNYYDLSGTNCLTAKAGDKQSALAVFNAILLFYSDGDVEQVAGIMFPNAFRQYNTTEFELPTITVASDVTLGYTLNILFAGNDCLSAVAVDSNSSLAMQAYNDMYRKLSNANIEITELNKKLATLQLTVDNVMRLLNNGLLGDMQSELQRLEDKLDTKFNGNISTDKLMQLFIQAKNNTGKLNLALSMSDLSNAVTKSAITVYGSRIGQFAAGDTIAAGTSITDIIRKLLDSRIASPYIQPIAGSTIDGDTYVLFRPGSKSFTVEHTVALGDAGAVQSRRLTTCALGGTITTTNLAANTSTVHRTMNVTAAEQTNDTVKCWCVTQQVQYAEGAMHQYDDGTDIEGNIQAGVVMSRFYAVPFEHVAIVHANQSVSIDLIAARINSGELIPAWNDSCNLDTYNVVENDVSFIIEAPVIDTAELGAGETMQSIYADLGITTFGECRSDIQLDLMHDGTMFNARITRIINWDGRLDTAHVRPNNVL